MEEGKLKGRVFSCLLDLCAQKHSTNNFYVVGQFLTPCLTIVAFALLSVSRLHKRLSRLLPFPLAFPANDAVTNAHCHYYEARYTHDYPLPLPRTARCTRGLAVPFAFW